MDESATFLSSIPTAFWVFCVIGFIGIWLSSFDRQLLSKKNGSHRFPSGPLCHDALVALDNYKYTSSEYTPLDNIMNDYWWVPLSNLIPMTVAPNLVTLSGVFLLIWTCGLNLYYNPMFDTPCPEWLSFITFISLFVYQTMDALDGKQARRTGASSPLGQLFDHGVDACVVTLIGIAVASATCAGPTGFLLLLVNLQLPFFLAQWGEKHTHVLRTNIGPIGVTEGQFLAFFICFCPALFGKAFWTLPISGWAPESLVSVVDIMLSCLNKFPLGSLSTSFASALTLTNGFFLLLIYCTMSLSATLFTLVATLATIGGKPKELVQSLLELTPVAVMLALCGIWSQQPSYSYAPRLMPFMIGLPFSHMTAQMIVAAMTRTKFAAVQPILLPLAFLVLPTFLTQHFATCTCAVSTKIISFVQSYNILQWISNPENIFQICALISILAPLRWACNACFQISQHLNIYVLRLGKRSEVEAKED